MQFSIRYVHYPRHGSSELAKMSKLSNNLREIPKHALKSIIWVYSFCGSVGQGANYFQTFFSIFSTKQSTYTTLIESVLSNRIRSQTFLLINQVSRSIGQDFHPFLSTQRGQQTQQVYVAILNLMVLLNLWSEIYRKPKPHLLYLRRPYSFSQFTSNLTDVGGNYELISRF